GKGTGLGLATVFAIVRESDGFLTVDSEEEKGTTFRIFLPLMEGATLAAPAAGAEPLPSGTERVIVVEDEESVRRLAGRDLERQGYEVLLAASGPDALELAGRGVPIDLVLSDVRMPEMSGNELARALKTRLPGVPVLFMSGHADDALLEEGVDLGRANLLRKP